jgi:hypothetical protein
MTITIKSIERIENGEPARKRLQETKDFVKLLDRCRAQVKLDQEPSPVIRHLYDAQHHILLRLCGGDIPENEGRRRDD